MNDTDRLAQIEQELHRLESCMQDLQSKLSSVETIATELRTWMSELMPAARQATSMLERRGKLLGMVMRHGG